MEQYEFQKTADIYESLMRKTTYRHKLIPNEHVYDKESRRYTALRLFESDTSIKIMQNKAKRNKDTFNEKDKEMTTIFEKKSNREIG